MFDERRQRKCSNRKSLHLVVESKLSDSKAHGNFQTYSYSGA